MQEHIDNDQKTIKSDRDNYKWITCLITREDSPCHGPVDEDTTCQNAHQAPRPLEQAIAGCHPVCYHQ